MTECSNCYAPLKKGEVGICDRCRHDAGIYSDSIAYNQETDEMDLRKVKITCPICGRQFAALLSKFTKAVRHYYLDSDCDRCGRDFKGVEMIDGIVTCEECTENLKKEILMEIYKEN